MHPPILPLKISAHCGSTIQSAPPREAYRGRSAALNLILVTFNTFVVLLLACSLAGGAQYWVATNGDDSNPGTKERPWLTVGKAASVARGNDFIHVTAGTYDEKVTPAHSGSAGTYITYKGEGNPVIRGFDFDGKSNWEVIGFHLYHPSTNYFCDGISVNRCMHFRILDNYFDSLNTAHAMVCCEPFIKNNYSSYGLIRSNLFYRAGLCPGRTVPGVNVVLVGTNNLVEYNDMSISDDFIRLFGKRNIVRNNYFHDTSYSHFSAQPHTDGIQTWDDPKCLPNFDRNIWERNLMISNSNPNGHVYILQNASPASVFLISDLTVRKNVALYTGGYVGLVDDVPNVRDYNNTWAVVGGAVTGSRHADFCTEASVNYLHRGTVLPTNFVGINDIYVQACRPDRGTIFGTPRETVINTRPPMLSVIGHNLTHESGPSIPKSSGPDILNRDPRFVSLGTYDTHLTANSPARNKACPQTLTTTGGERTDIVAVADAGFFTDGWGIEGVDGDEVLIGENSAATITHIDYDLNTLTLSKKISYHRGDGVFLEGTQDIGAFDYSPEGYSYGITLTSPRDLASVSGETLLTASVANPKTVRIVRFYVDGMEVGHAPPAAVVSVRAEISGTSHHVEARAYALNADNVLAVTSSVTLNSTSSNP
jgi:hypothetical protein